jgi:hypothetical protein
MDWTTPRTRVAAAAGVDAVELDDAPVVFASLDGSLLHAPKLAIALPSSASLFIIIATHLG